MADLFFDFKLTIALGALGVAKTGIFGVPLNISIKYANVAISLNNEHGESFIYGYVPIVVAKCGVFLKEQGESSTQSPVASHFDLD